MVIRAIAVLGEIPVFVVDFVKTGDASVFGRELARNTVRLTKVLCVNADARCQRLEDVATGPFKDRRDGVRRWYEHNFLDAVKLVPKGLPSKQFLDGIFAALDAGIVF